MLEIRDLTVEYTSGGYTVRPIQHLNLDVEAGHLVILLGASGSGKTTLLSALAGLLRPSSGTIRFDGVDVTQLRGQALTRFRRHTVGVVFQAFNLIPSLTALENVAVPLWAAGMRRGARRRAEQLVADVDLTDRARHRPGDMSGGQQQRVAIARALAHDPPLLLADEPTAHLDHIQVEGVLRLLRAVASPGRVVIVATHDERLLPLADRIVDLSPKAAVEARPPERHVLADGEVLFRQDDEGDVVYIVESGEIEVVRTRADGSEEVMTRIGEGRYFGELAPLFGLKRSGTARAVGATVVTAHSVADFRQRMGPHLAEVISATYE